MLTSAYPVYDTIPLYCEVKNVNLYSVNQEAYILLATVYGGILIGFIYDLYRVVRGIFHPKKFATSLQDIFFWTIISVVAFYILIFSNQGALRFYNFMGFAAGVLAYQYLLSGTVLKVVGVILKAVQRFIIDCVRLVLYPCRVGICLIEVPYTYCKKKTKPVYYKAKRFMGLPGSMLGETKRTIRNYFRKK
jgi:spore cortex biosynthesis protein YabQ